MLQAFRISLARQQILNQWRLAGPSSCSESWLGVLQASTLGAARSYSVSKQSNAVHTSEVGIGGRTLQFEVGSYAKQADGACLVKYGKTHVLATAVCLRKFDPASDFMPFQVDYRERLSAVGRIPSTNDRRERFGSDREVLVARLIDRALRPLFPPGFYYETQLVASVLAGEVDMDPDVLALNASSLALCCSDIPFVGPVGAVRVGYVDGAWVINPNSSQLALSPLNLTYAGTATHTLMVECISDQIAEDLLAEALQVAQREVQVIVEAQQQVIKAGAKAKRAVALAAPGPEAAARLEALALEPLHAILADSSHTKPTRDAALLALKEQLAEQLTKEGVMEEKPSNPSILSPAAFYEGWEALAGRVLRQLLLTTGRRVDGRAADEMRPVSASVGDLPVVHGSALFQRGDTQSLCSVTVGNEYDQQRINSLAGKTTKQFIVHYGFPPFAVNETGKVGAPGRREIGHGNLAERALIPVFPSSEDFPFTLRLHSETLSSNGSSSMAASCGGSMALRDAGVPIKALVAGISVGLITEHWPEGPGQELAAGQHLHVSTEYGREVLITDIQDIEDHWGFMDYKVAGTRKGITAVQLDCKLPGLRVDTLVQALVPARAARLSLLDVMEAAVAAAVTRQSEQDRPYYGTITINKELVKTLIGVEGEHIHRIMGDTGSAIIVGETGEVDIYAPTRANYDAAVYEVQDVEGAHLHEGDVVRVRVFEVKDYGAMVLLPTGSEAMIHISELSWTKARDIKELVRLGQEFDVQCLGKDARGVILSKKALMPKPEPPAATPVESAAADASDDSADTPATSSASGQASGVTGRPHHHPPKPHHVKAKTNSPGVKDGGAKDAKAATARTSVGGGGKPTDAPLLDPPKG